MNYFFKSEFAVKPRLMT